MKRVLLLYICIAMFTYAHCAHEGKACVKPATTTHYHHRRSSAADREVLQAGVTANKTKIKQQWKQAGKAALQESQSGANPQASGKLNGK